MAEITKGKPALHLLHTLYWQWHSIALCQGQQGGWLDRTFKVDVQFNFGDSSDVTFDLRFHTYFFLASSFLLQKSSTEGQRRLDVFSDVLQELYYTEINGIAMRATKMPIACNRVTRSLRMIPASRTVAAG